MNAVDKDKQNAAAYYVTRINIQLLLHKSTLLIRQQYENSFIL